MEAASSPEMTSPSLTEIGNVTSAMTWGSPDYDPYIRKLFHAALYLLRVAPPVILAVGTLGNVMTVVIMRRLTSSSSEDSTIHIYFTAIAVVDLLYLWTVVLDQSLKYNVGIDIKTVHGAFCKVFTWLYTGGGTVSCWYLVCMTAHRAVSVVWPHRVSLLCTRRAVVVLLASVTGSVAALYAHYLVGYDAVSKDGGKSYACTLASEGYVRFHSDVFVYLELLLYSALPFLLIALANTALVWRLLASAKGANRRLAEGSGSQTHNQREKEANSVTLTIMTLSVTFLVLTLPSSLTFILNYLVSTGHTQASQNEVWKAISITIVCSLLSHTNHAVNFYLYCLTGRRFREEFFRILCCGRAGSRAQGRSGKDQAASG